MRPYRGESQGDAQNSQLAWIHITLLVRFSVLVSQVLMNGTTFGPSQGKTLCQAIGQVFKVSRANTLRAKIQPGQLLSSVNHRFTVLILRRWYTNSMLWRANEKRRSTFPAPGYTCYKVNCQTPPPPLRVILSIKQATDQSVKFVCYKGILSYIHMKKAAKVTPSASVISVLTLVTFEKQAVVMTLTVLASFLEKKTSHFLTQV